MTVFFTADTHFNHLNVIKYCNRPYDSIEHMNESIIARWNKHVKQDDIVYHLGDFLFGNRDLFPEFWNRLNGQKMLIVGNHDVKVPSYVPRATTLVEKIDGIKVHMSHFPLLEWDDMNYGAFHLHGHCHGSRGKVLNERSLDVGIDGPESNYAPIPWVKVKKLLGRTPIKKHAESKNENQNSETEEEEV